MDNLIFDEDTSLIRWKPNVALTSALVRDYFSDIAASEWGNTADRFTDFSNLPSVDLDYSEMQRVANLRRRTLVNNRRIKVAIYAPRDLEFATSRMYQSVMADEDMEIAVSRDLNELSEFLDRPVSSFAWNDDD